LVPEHDVSQELKQQCAIVVDQLSARYRWRLLDRDDFVRRALWHLGAGVADRLVNAAIGAYCAALYSACSGAEGPLRQDQAYGEVARYLYSLACMRFADLSLEAREDVAQSALERIYKSFDRCREPVAFLAFAGQHLLDAVRVARRQERQMAKSLDQALGRGEEVLGDMLYDQQPQPIEHIIAGERRTAVEQLLQEFLLVHPRSAQQVAILRLTWIDDMDDATIGQRLSISLSSVYTARSRLKKTIQSEPRWQARAIELGIVFDEL
jgi:RNA polymerase sigma factor (sigma-70 family)